MLGLPRTRVHTDERTFRKFCILVNAERDPVVSGCLFCGDSGFLALDFLKKPGSSRVM